MIKKICKYCGEEITNAEISGWTPKDTFSHTAPPRAKHSKFIPCFFESPAELLPNVFYHIHSSSMVCQLRTFAEPKDEVD